MDDFERDLLLAMHRRPAPPGLKRRLMERRRRLHTLRFHARTAMWQRVAASLVLAAVVGGAWAWHDIQERRRGEEASRQVFTALRIANHALDTVNARLTGNRGADHE